MIFNEDGELRVWAGIVLVIGWIAMFAAGPVVAGAWIDAARVLTFGHPSGMAVAGWLIYWLPCVLFLVTVPRWTRRPIPRWAYLMITIALALVAVDVCLFPAGNQELLPLVDGPGGAGFVTGLRCGLVAGAVTTFVMPPLLFSDAARRSPDPVVRLVAVLAPFVTFLIATLLAAIVLA
ncbi:hypothetical protein AB0M02_08330 [Actinoplanes sp. NPDC051861]|uniref:hypothetical protein n=1 Tax=Actinoplanes sp. NPDC051861 TaxID=3155170 RepID=UPI00343B5A7F